MNKEGMSRQQFLASCGLFFTEAVIGAVLRGCKPAPDSPPQPVSLPPILKNNLNSEFLAMINEAGERWISGENKIIIIDGQKVDVSLRWIYYLPRNAGDSPPVFRDFAMFAFITEGADGQTASFSAQKIPDQGLICYSDSETDSDIVYYLGLVVNPDSEKQTADIFWFTSPVKGKK